MRTASPIGLCGLFVLGLCLSSAVAAPDDKKEEKAKDLIVGQWIPTQEKDKDKAVLEFTKDGKVILKVTDGGKTVELAGTYKFLGEDKIEVELALGNDKKKETLKVKVTKDELTTTDSKDKVDTFKRGK